MGDNFQDMVSSHGPRKIKDIVAAVGIMNFLSIRQDQTLSRGDTPNDSHVVLCSKGRKREL